MHFYQVYDGWTASGKVLYDQKKMQNNIIACDKYSNFEED